MLCDGVACGSNIIIVQHYCFHTNQEHHVMAMQCVAIFLRFALYFKIIAVILKEG